MTDLLTPAEMAQLLGVSQEALTSRRKRGSIPSRCVRMIGAHTVRYDRAEVLAWLASLAPDDSGHSVKGDTE